MTTVSKELWKPQGIRELEQDALDGVKEVSRSICVTAGPGAGKTEFLAQKADFLLRTAACRPPHRILAISFKRDAARNLGERVADRVAQEHALRFHSMTFDAFTKSLVDQFGTGLPEAFRPPEDYEIGYPTTEELTAFTSRHRIPVRRPGDVNSLVAGDPYPFGEARRDFVPEYWSWMYRSHEPTRLTFAMINRLAILILATNPHIRSALQATYPYVFLDEFQDVTGPQYELLRVAFSNGATRFTAVGDDKQKIMTWAGALPNAFSRFIRDYDAIQFSLRLNWRSHEALVAVQRVIAATLQADAVPIEARGKLAVDGDVAAVWTYDSREAETAGIGGWLSAQTKNGVHPHEIAILVRQRVGEAETALKAPLEAAGIRLRNVAGMVGDIDIQDLLSEPLTGLLLPLLRLGSSERNRGAWQAARSGLYALNGLSGEHEVRSGAIEQQLGEFVNQFRAGMKGNAPNPGTASRLLAELLKFLGERELRTNLRAYRRDADFYRALGGFTELFSQSTVGAATWEEVLDDFEGLGQVPMMTIHKSKGLEFNTIIFYGLDQKSWWSLTEGQDEELRTFFVAFTRAEQRAFFTYARDHGAPVSWLMQLLKPAGLVVKRGPGA